MAFLINFVVLSGYVELTEKVEGNDCIDVDNDSQEHQSQNKFFAVMSDGLKNDFQSGHTDCDIEKMGGEEEIIVIAQNREHKVTKLVQKWLKVKNVN